MIMFRFRAVYVDSGCDGPSGRRFATGGNGPTGRKVGYDRRLATAVYLVISAGWLWPQVDGPLGHNAGKC